MTTVEQKVERVARESYGRLLAFLAAQSGDVIKAEEALSDAFAAALETWPRRGEPNNPEAWLLSVARRKGIDEIRRQKTRTNLVNTLAKDAEEKAADISPAQTFPEHRLNLMFVCAHPAIDSSIRAPLILNTVLGLTADRMASAFLVKPSAMSQRLVRGKRKIRDARIRFSIPEPEDLPERLDAVLEAIYAAYGVAWENVAGQDGFAHSLSDEAIWLARILVQQMPQEPEPRGLLALMLYCESRKQARRGRDGSFIPLYDQDTSLWNRPIIDEAENELMSASKMGKHGRFQLEASIQSAHTARINTGLVDWETIATLYEGLVQIAPTIGALVSRASTLAKAKDASFALAELDRLPHQAVANYQPFWALRFHLLNELGRNEEAEKARQQAIGLTEDPSVRAYLLS
ncbi:MAG: sigma factor [Verrucomicrobia bacterium]|nr:sigma factor [Verrucomicrobiota bacterium]